MSRKKPAPSIQKILNQKRPKRVQWVIGIDEVGRGPVAGPVTVCAFALRTEFLNDIAKMGFRDSKKLSPQKREQCAQILNNCAQLHMCTWAIESNSSSVIDSRGISHAISSAIEKCLKKLNLHPEEVDIYLDGGLRAPKSYFRQHTVIRGDDLFPVISCASILAKVYRDHVMDWHDQMYPDYGFIDNKGYGTPDHYRAIKKHGFSPLHRSSFLRSVVRKSVKKQSKVLVKKK